MEKKSKKLDEKIQQITFVYKELTKSEFYIVKKNLIDTLRKLCAEGLDIIDNENVTPENLRKRKQIDDMLKRTKDIQQKIDTQQKDSPTIGQQNKNPRLAFHKTNNTHQKEQNSNVEQQMDSQILRQKSVQVAKSMIVHELTSQNINIKMSELEQLAMRIQKNHQVMKEMEMMVIEQGGNLDKVEEEIIKTYENVVEVNVELDEAKKIQTRNRILKLRMGISGFLGAIGIKILGLPGLIFGFFGGMIATQ